MLFRSQLPHTSHTLLCHVAPSSFNYLLGSLSPLPQPIEAIAGVQPVVGVVVLTHSLPTTSTFVHSRLFLPLLLPALYPLVSSLSPSLSETKRVDLSPLWSSLSGCVERRAGRRWGRGGGVVGEGEERKREGREGGGRTMVLLWQQLPPVFIWKPCMAKPK